MSAASERSGGGLVDRALAASAALAGATLGRAASAGVSLCADASPPRIVCSGLGVLESVIVDSRGRLFFTSQTWTGGLAGGALLRADAPGQRPTAISVGIDSPGGLAFAADGRLIVGYGDGPLTGLIGNVAGRAGLFLVDPESGERELWVTGLGMSNGVARAPDGAVYASDDVANGIDRISPDGTVQRGWARVWSANGLAVDPAGRYLYAAVTFTRAAVKRIEIADPRHVSIVARPPIIGAGAMLDGLALDDSGRLYVAANGAGQVWRIGPDGTICALARGLRFPSAVALGRGPDGFRAGNAYAVTFCGDVVEFDA
jgi:gluconolactonase